MGGAGRRVARWWRLQFGERIYSEIRRFVIIREGPSYCTALPISTYDGQGVGKKAILKSEHAIAYTGREPPPLTPAELPKHGEHGVLGSIRVNLDSPEERLDPMSRINLGKLYTIEHNIKVRSVGMVHNDSKSPLLRMFTQVWTTSLMMNPHAPNDLLQSAPPTTAKQESYAKVPEDDKHTPKPTASPRKCLSGARFWAKIL